MGSGAVQWEVVLSSGVVLSRGGVVLSRGVLSITGSDIITPPEQND